MLFTEPLFIFYFLPFALLLHNAFLKNTTRYPKSAAWIFFISTILFYYFQQPFWLIPLFYILIIDHIYIWLIQKNLNQTNRKRILIIFIVLNLLPLIVFKYQSWIGGIVQVQSYGTLAALPAGISFYTFESISLLIDTYRKEVSLPLPSIYISAFLGMFPRIIAGPIVRFKIISDQFTNYKKPLIEKGLFIFVIGLSFKCLFADSLSYFTQYAFDRKTAIDMLSAWFGLFSYALQLYFDFFGYSLMAIGLSLLFGFILPWNFDLPFHSKSITEFWNRWHITLGTWVKAYLYFPLAMKAQHSKILSALVVFTTMFIIGLWHGAGVQFIYYGIWFGFWLVIDFTINPFAKLPAIIAKIVTFIIVLIGLLMIRVKDTQELYTVFQALFCFKININNTALLTNPMRSSLSILSVLFCFWIEPKIKLKKWIEDLNSPLSYKLRFISVFLFLTCLMVSYSSKMVPFLYFQF